MDIGWRRGPMVGLCLGLLFSAGCMKTTVALEPVPGTINVKHADAKRKSHFFLFGVINRHEYDLDKICPEGPHWAVNRSNFEDVLLTLVTLGIYTPQTEFFGCKGRKGVRPLGPKKERR